jgi:hypothetical protein
MRFPRSRLLARVSKVRPMNQRSATFPIAKHKPTSRYLSD